MQDQRFDEPFFSRTVAAWTKRGREKRWTGTDVLAALDTLPSRDPDLIIAHASRCGSTLLARMMSAIPNAILISEPMLLADIMRYGSARPRETIDTLLRQAVRALGRIRFGDETRYILKLPSSGTRWLPALRRTFPTSPIVWLQRQPEEILVSELRHPSNWVGGRKGPEPLETRVLRKVALGFLSAAAHVTEDMLVLDYRDLPDAAWTTVAPFMGYDPEPDEIAAMKRLTLHHAKSGEVWTPRGTETLDPRVRSQAERELVPLYAQLDRRRLTSMARA